MKRRFHILAAALALFTAVEVPQAMARHITVDGDPTDWTGVLPPQPNLAHITRDMDSCGEFVWLDETGDEQNVFQTPDPEADLTEFRVTADATSIYFLARFLDLTLASGDGSVMVQVALDLDRQAGSGEQWFGLWSDTQVDQDARWEYLVATRFGEGLGVPRLYDVGFNDIAGTDCENAIDTDQNIVEVRVPWALLSPLTGPPDAPIRFTVMVCRSTAGGDCLDVTNASDAIDVVSHYGYAGRTDAARHTEYEVQDGVVDHHFEVSFNNITGEVYAPVVVSEVFPNPIGNQDLEEFVELANVSPLPIDLTYWKVGDEETPGGGEGMASFGSPGPGGLELASISPVVVARDGVAFAGFFYFDADFEFTYSTNPAPEMLPYTEWATGTFTLNNGGDQIVVLDPFDTVVDVFEFQINEWWPVVSYTTAITAGHSIERVSTFRDRDDCSLDFLDRPNPTPGSLPTKKGLGETCADDSECASTFCSNDVCCLERCESTCQACNSLGVCGIAPVSQTCDDGNPCTSDDHCSGISTVCISGTPYSCSPSLCEDSSVCDGTGGCTATYTAPNTPCDDQDPCTTDTVCDGGGTCSGNVIDCTPGPCEDSSICDGAGGCTVTYSAPDTPCDDSDPCTMDTVCDGSGTCSGGSSYTCAPALCEEASECDGQGGCTVTYSAADTPCDDSDPCTQDTVCDGAGGCSGGVNICSADGGIPDGGDDTDGGGETDGGAGSDGSVPPPDSSTQAGGSDSKGCSCRAAGPHEGAGSFLLLTLILLLVSCCRRRRCSTKR